MLVASMTERPAHDYGLESLLAMDGVVFVIEHGHWIKIEARVVVSNRHVPHGVRYSLTLHDRNKRRLVGYDNAHAVKARKRRFAPRLTEWDNRHRLHEVFEYQFESAEKLLVDFWNDVYEMLFGVNRKK